MNKRSVIINKTFKLQFLHFPHIPLLRIKLDANSESHHALIQNPLSNSNLLHADFFVLVEIEAKHIAC